MAKITNVYKELRNLGVTVPSAIWNDIKSKEAYFNELVHTDDDTGVDYINKTSVGLLRSVYQRLYEEPNVVVQPEYKYVIAGKGFYNSEGLKSYLSAMLKHYNPDQSLSQQDRAFLADLLSRSPKIKQEVGKYGYVVDLMVAIKPGHSGKTFHIVYLNGRKQSISMLNYIDPGKEVLVDLWGKN